MAETGEPYSVAARALKQEFDQLDPFNGAKADFGELILFTERLYALLNADNDLYEALVSLVQYTDDPVLKEGLEFVTSSPVGSEISKAMAKRPNAFRGIMPEIIDKEWNLTTGIRSLTQVYRVELEMEQRREHRG